MNNESILEDVENKVDRMRLDGMTVQVKKGKYATDLPMQEKQWMGQFRSSNEAFPTAKKIPANARASPRVTSYNLYLVMSLHPNPMMIGMQ